MRLKAIIAATVAPTAFALEYVPLLRLVLLYAGLAVLMGVVSRGPGPLAQGREAVH